MFELVDRAVSRVPCSYVADYYRRHGKWPLGMAPGEFVSRQPPEIRELLKKLTSDDLSDVRMWA